MIILMGYLLLFLGLVELGGYDFRWVVWFDYLGVVGYMWIFVLMLVLWLDGWFWIDDIWWGIVFSVV